MNRQITSAFNFLRHSEYHICSWRLFSGIVTFVKNKIKHLSKKVTVCFCSFWSEICSVVSNSLWPHELYSPWHSPGQNTEVGSLSLLQGIFPTQGSNLYSQVSHTAGRFFTSWITRGDEDMWVLSPGRESFGQRSLVGYSAQGWKQLRVRHEWATFMSK